MSQRDAQQNSAVSHSTGGNSVTFSLPWVVKGADTPQDAINIAVSEVGKCITDVGSPILDVDLSVQQLSCGSCRRHTDATLIVSGTALVGLELTAVVEAAPTDAETVARRRLGPTLPGTPLTTPPHSETR